MNQQQYFERFRDEVEKMCRLTGCKNNDYANSEDPFKNFTAIEYLSSGKITATAGILTRMSDKFQRIVNLLVKDEMTGHVNESVLDNLQDLATYSVILKMFLEEQERTKRYAQCGETAKPSTGDVFVAGAEGHIMAPSALRTGIIREASPRSKPSMVDKSPRRSTAPKKRR